MLLKFPIIPSSDSFFFTFSKLLPEMKPVIYRQFKMYFLLQIKIQLLYLTNKYKMGIEIL